MVSLPAVSKNILGGIGSVCLEMTWEEHVKIQTWKSGTKKEDRGVERVMSKPVSLVFLKSVYVTDWDILLTCNQLAINN